MGKEQPISDREHLAARSNIERTILLSLAIFHIITFGCSATGFCQDRDRRRPVVGRGPLRHRPGHYGDRQVVRRRVPGDRGCRHQGNRFEDEAWLRRLHLWRQSHGVRRGHHRDPSDEAARSSRSGGCTRETTHRWTQGPGSRTRLRGPGPRDRTM